jgi:hypothetical protein
MSLFQPFDLPEGIMLVISDELGAPGDFLLHRALASHLKDRKKTKAIVLSVAEGLSRWKALAFKSVRYRNLRSSAREILSEKVRI